MLYWLQKPKSMSIASLVQVLHPPPLNSCTVVAPEPMQLTICWTVALLQQAAVLWQHNVHGLQREHERAVLIVPEEGRPISVKDSVRHVGVQHFWSQNLACPPYFNKPASQLGWGAAFQ